ncbi:MAG: 30S ribosomal protein S17 [Elusimicrobia bacterium]|nr:30S ribosomal protein S17 [Elusimicrobiota bacterium]
MNKKNTLYKTTSRKRLVGLVVGDEQAKTRIVKIERKISHPVYLKVISKNKKYYAHDEKEISSLGDEVVIEESRPMSRLKRWRVVEVRK